MKRRHVVAGALLPLLVPVPAWADNCSDLSDCYQYILAAVAVVLAIALVLALIEIAAAVAAAEAAALADLTAGTIAAAEAAAAEAGMAAVAEGGVAAAAEAAGFSATEAGIIAEAEAIMSSTEMASIVEAHAGGESLMVEIGGRLIQYEPGMPAAGMTLFGENGFVIGNQAFATEGELGRTVLHELYRLGTSVSLESGVSGASAAGETEATFTFAGRAWEFLKGLGL